MACCAQCRPIAEHFDRRVADQDRKRYHRAGPGPTTRLILEEVKQGFSGAGSLLDVGGGIGVIGLELLAAGEAGGLQRVTLVEAAPAYAAAAEEEYAARNARDRLVTMLGDFAEMEALPLADVVTLDRVVCCYPDVGRLLDRAARRTGRVLALSFPRDRWYVRAGLAAVNLFLRLRRVAFRTFVHPEREITRALTASGLRRTSRRLSLVWCVEVWVPTA